MVSPMAATAAAAFPVLVVWAGAVDTLTRSIPNSVVAALAAGFALFAMTAGLTILDAVAHLLCAFGILACGFALYRFSLLGGGDAKLTAGAALWFGFDQLLPFLESVALAGGVLSLAYIAANAMLTSLGWPLAGTRQVPYGAAIAAGALAVLPDWLAAY
jgi:prepilin peptidase CpaA